MRSLLLKFLGVAAAAFLAIPALHGQVAFQVTTVSGEKLAVADLVFPTGRELRVNSGGTFNVASGATVTIGAPGTWLTAFGLPAFNSADPGATNRFATFNDTSNTVQWLSPANFLLDLGIDASVTEINYIDGVSGPLQPQIDGKAPIDNATFTGTTDVELLNYDRASFTAVDLGTVANGGTSTEATALAVHKITNSGATATINLPASPGNGWTRFIGLNTSGGAATITVDTAMIRMGFDPDDTATTFTLPSSSNGRWELHCYSEGGSYLRFYTIGDNDTAVAAAQISDASANGRSLLTAADYAAMKSLLTLNNVDNTSDATKNSATATLAGKTIALNAALGSDDTSTGQQIAGLNAGATIAQWEVVYLDTTATEWLLADNDGTGTYPARGLAVAAGTDGNALAVLVSGTVRNDAWNWTVGGTIYLSDTPGALTQTKPTAAGDRVQQVGFALTADIAYFNFASGEFFELQ